jgi:hypothetical protein
LFSGRLREAEAALSEALRRQEMHGFREAFGEILIALGAIAARDGEHHRAAQLLGAARTAGYPPAKDAEIIDHRLERDYYSPARTRYGHAAWSQAESQGAAMTQDQSIAFAIAESHVRIRSGKVRLYRD